jgi:hypothetical protein
VSYDTLHQLIEEELAASPQQRVAEKVTAAGGAVAPHK